MGDAMLAGQRQLKDDTFRGRIFGAGALRGWKIGLLPRALSGEKDDRSFFKITPSQQTVADFKTALANRLGELPPVPETGFIGRSRELLALQRLFRQERYAVVRGQGGEGKTALAAEFARWMVRSQQMRRAAFVSVETHSNQLAVLDALGRQLVGQSYSVAAFDELEKAILPVERALREQATLLVVDNMESILLPPYLETSEALTEDAARELQAILALCERLLRAGDTRLVFTSRESLPAPFDAQRNRRELHQLDREDAVKLVERALNAENNGGDAGDTGCRARSHRSAGGCRSRPRPHAGAVGSVVAARRRGKDPRRSGQADAGNGQTLSRRLSRQPREIGLCQRRTFAPPFVPANRERARVLGVFHGGFQ